jgi:MoxR-like ATPase
MKKLAELYRCFKYTKAKVFQTVDTRSQFVLIDEYNEARIPLDNILG